MSGISVVGKANLLGLLFEGAAVGDIGRLRQRVDDTVIEKMLGDKHHGPGLRRLATHDPDPWVRRVVARNTKALTVTDLEALLDLPDPIVDRLVYAHPAALPWMRRVVLTPGRHPRDPQAPHPLAALHETILAHIGEPPTLTHFVGAAIVCDIPELATHALRIGGSTLTPAEQLRGLLSLRRHGDADAVAAALPFVRPEVAEVAEAADGDLAAAVEAAEGVAGLVA
ncbi:hypothetical protein, partial [Streptomyces sp. SID3343]|uniref:hypothetical protein n=1 Tax=Streptomyces sp. SID3343 TaxID=2690260 RepID=UPI0013BF3C55